MDSKDDSTAGTSGAGAVDTAGSPTGTQLTVLSKHQEAEGVVSVVLGHRDGRRLPDWEPGAHIDIVMPDGTMRQYSLSGDRFDPLRYRISVLREPASRGGSLQVHEAVQVGDAVGIGGPRNNFRMVPADRYLFIAGGIGITPLLPMIDQAERIGADWTLLYGGRSRATMAFLDALAAYDGGKVVIHPEDEHGLMPLAEHIGTPDVGRVVYACGPSPLLAAVEALCADWPEGALRTERFVADTLIHSDSDRPFDVVLDRSGQTVRVDPGVSILAAVRAAGVTALTSCEQGLCGTCETAVVTGRPDHRDSLLDDAERAANESMYICVSRSLDPTLVLDL